MVIFGSFPPRVAGWRQAEPQVDTSPHSQPLQAHFDGRVHVNIVRYRRFIPTTPPLRILTGRGGPHRCGRVEGTSIKKFLAQSVIEEPLQFRGASQHQSSLRRR